MIGEGRFGRMEAAPVGKLWVRDPESGGVSLVDADPVTVDSSAFLSGLSDVSDPSNPVPFSGDDSEDTEPAEAVEVEAEVVEPESEVEAVVEPESEVVEAEEGDEDEVEAVEEFTPAPGFEAPKPAPAKRGRPKKATQ